MRINIALASTEALAGVTQETWDKYDSKQKKAFLAKYPNSKYATDGKKGKTEKAGGGKASASFDFEADSAAEVAELIKLYNRRKKTSLKAGKAVENDNGNMEAVVSGDKKELQGFAVQHYGSKEEAKDVEPSLFR